MSTDLASGLEKIVGEQLSAVTFVMDYWQLAFDGPMLTAFSRVTVGGPRGVVSNGHPEFRNQLCECIGHVVVTITLQPHQCIAVIFDDGRRIEISLREQDYRGPEALLYHPDGPGRVIYVL